MRGSHRSCPSGAECQRKRSAAAFVRCSCGLRVTPAEARGGDDGRHRRAEEPCGSCARL